MKKAELHLLFFWAVFLSAALIMGGCGGGSGGGGGAAGPSYWGGGSGGGAVQAYSVSGTLRDATSNQPVQGATCTLSQTKARVVITTAITDQNGRYNLTGVPAGTYSLTITKDNYISYETNDLSITQDTANEDCSIMQTLQWNQMAGSDHPFDESKSYIIVEADVPSKGLRGAGISATITPSGGVQIGYLTDATPPTIDWSATSTYQNGGIIFYNLTSSLQYTLSFTSPGTIFASLSILPSSGGTIQNYSVLATAPAPDPTTTPTPTPTPIPTSSPSPTASPQPSPTPTQSPGGGGGGGGGGTPVAAKLGFKVQPTDVTAGVAITPTVEVAIQDASGNTVATATGDITIAIGTNPGDSTLSGTTTLSAVAGVAAFDDLSLDKAGEGYTLTATSGALTEATSGTFNVTSRDYTAWTDQGIVYTAPAAGNAYYPCVLYDANGFEDAGEKYALWYSDGSGAVFLVTSSDGTSWSAPTTMSGLGGKPNHAQVLYDADRFGLGPSGPKYRIWYWDNNADLYSISSIATARSVDGVTWDSYTALTQDASAKLVTGGPVTDWNRGSYGPVHLFYQPGAADSGTDPWSYSYVMYYDGTTGGPEATGLAYSADGLFWKAYTVNPVLSPSASPAWDSKYSTFGTVYHDAAGYHFWYSGGVTTLNEGIGYAFSTDGKAWTKNPSHIFHISDAYAVSYRNSRVCTPSVIDDGTGVLKMYYTAQASGGLKKIGRATLAP
ncbi:MAG: carboxypeptidase regulatory-like domain-containing protein [Candidatus Eremiobacteraeota bacterium]|nr:carboxypeptidase regulatory-like domain-containing protein [Candidatus Eremiobacteraeota bacterium]